MLPRRCEAGVVAHDFGIIRRVKLIEAVTRSRRSDHSLSKYDVPQRIHLEQSNSSQLAIPANAEDGDGG